MIIINTPTIGWPSTDPSVTDKQRFCAQLLKPKTDIGPTATHMSATVPRLPSAPTFFFPPQNDLFFPPAEWKGAGCLVVGRQPQSVADVFENKFWFWCEESKSAR